MSLSGNGALSRLERIYLVSQGTTIGTFAAATNSSAMRHIKCVLKNDVATLLRRDKTGARTATVGVRGRGFGNWSIEASLAPNGTGGTAPDFEALLVSAFGQAPAVGGGVRTYSFLDTPDQYFSLYSYRQPSTLNQRAGLGCLTNELTINMGQDIAEFTASGECSFVLESDFFGSASTWELGGLSGSFPTEPSSPVTNGGIIAGFTGAISIGGNQIGRIRTLTTKLNNQATMIKDDFNQYEPQESQGDVRMVTCTFNMYESDEASQQAIRVATINKTPVNITASVGLVSGSIVEVDLVNVQLQSYDLDDSSVRYSLSVPESRAFGTSITSRDELTLKIR